MIRICVVVLYGRDERAHVEMCFEEFSVLYGVQIEGDQILINRRHHITYLRKIIKYNFSKTVHCCGYGKLVRAKQMIIFFPASHKFHVER